MYNSPLHQFHIPVMGLAYTIDTPVKVARFGISSVISIMNDKLIEMMRRHYYSTIAQEYQPISIHEPDYRAKRITDYLNLVNTIVQDQIKKLKSAAFEAGSEIVKYFEMLPDDSRLKQLYRQMMSTDSQPERLQLEKYLQTQIWPGDIDVNIMTKVDRNNFNKQGELIEDGSDAVAALRGYANSNLTRSSVVFSAGMNPRLYNYLEKCPAFDVNENGEFDKKVIVKVSDYRSALIQGKYLAKKGIWVSEFRIESGLNCGGHAFATDGFLLGPILEEFKQKEEELINALFEIYNVAIQQKSRKKFLYPPMMKLSVQGGIGTYEEDRFLHDYYKMDSTGWGTPFLLVPEATTVDEPTLQLLANAKQEDLELSHNSPLGVRFHYLKGTSAAKEKQQRIDNGKPGSPCTEKHLEFNTEFTDKPICTASHKYQKLKIEQLKSLKLPEQEYQKKLKLVLDKECLCVGLSNAATSVTKTTFVKNQEAVTICPGPNIAYFSKEVSLQTMADHIYGRTDIIEHGNRPHMFITELNLYIDYLKEQVENREGGELNDKQKKFFMEFSQNLGKGIAYYRNLQNQFTTGKEAFNTSLDKAQKDLHNINHQFSIK